MAVIVVMMLVGIILIYIAANLRSLELLRRDLRLVEKQQASRLHSPESGTNNISAAKSASSSGSGLNTQ